MTYTDIKALRAQKSLTENKLNNETSYSEFINLFNQHEAEKPKIPGIVNARITTIREDLGYVVVDIGHKSEGQIKIAEFMSDGKLEYKEGDVVEVYATLSPCAYEEIEVSKRDADRLRSWDAISVACENNEIVKGRIIQKVKGGLNVDINGVKAFLPGSQVDLYFVRDFEKFVNPDLEYDFKVIKFNRRRNNIVLSRKQALIEKRELIRSLDPNHTYQGTIIQVNRFSVQVQVHMNSQSVTGELHEDKMNYALYSEFRFQSRSLLHKNIEINVDRIKKNKLYLKSALAHSDHSEAISTETSPEEQTEHIEQKHVSLPSVNVIGLEQETNRRALWEKEQKQQKLAEMERRRLWDEEHQRQKSEEDERRRLWDAQFIDSDKPNPPLEPVKVEDEEDDYW